MRRYKFSSVYILCMARSCFLVCECMYMSIYMRSCVGVCRFLPLLHVHSLYDTTMTRLSRLEKGGGALAGRRRPNSYSTFARRRFYSLSFSPLVFLFPLSQENRLSDFRLVFTIAKSYFLDTKPGEGLSTLVCLAHAVFSEFFFLLF